MPRPRAPEPAARGGEAGFTLLETLVALTVASILSIGIVRFMASTHLVAAHADRKLAVAALETAVVAAIPPPRALTAFQKSGSRDGLDWQITGVPLPEDAPRAAPEPVADAGSPAPDPAQGDANEEVAPTHDWRRYAITISISSGGRLLDQVELTRIGSAIAPDADAEQ